LPGENLTFLHNKAPNEKDYTKGEIKSKDEKLVKKNKSRLEFDWID
jgi:hypothetical protein